MFLLILAAVFLFAGWLHLQPKFRPSLAWFKNAESRLNHHLAGSVWGQLPGLDRSPGPRRHSRISGSACGLG
jgi:hypothetical protein